MADSNIFGGAQATPVDSDELAMGTGGSFFNITWAAVKSLLNTAGFFKSGDDLIAKSGIFNSINTSIGDSRYELIISEDNVPSAGRGGGLALGRQSVVYGGIKVTQNSSSDANTTMYFQTRASDIINNRMVLNEAGNLTITGAYSPFTGTHVAKSNEVLKLGELVQIKSVGWVNPKQPDWKASYCNGSKKGIYGVVYDIQVVDIMEDYEETIITKKLLLKDKSEVVTKQRKIGEYTQYLIASVGDGFIEVDCPCEYGDVLIPSETKGLATVYKGDYIPLNSVGFAGENSEGGKISWTKE